MKENLEFNSIINNNKNIKIKIESENINEKIQNESIGNNEYILCLKKALKEAIDQNDKVNIF